VKIDQKKFLVVQNGQVVRSADSKEAAVREASSISDHGDCIIFSPVATVRPKKDVIVEDLV
jgi:hypothetical protein